MKQTETQTKKVENLFTASEGNLLNKLNTFVPINNSMDIIALKMIGSERMKGTKDVK